MKTNKRFLFVTVALLAAYVLSACGGVPAASPAEQAAVKVDASLVAYTGTIESITGDQWVVNGQTLTVAPAVVRDGPFQVGDVVKVEGNVNPDGSFTVSRVEAPTASDLTELPPLGNDNANANSNDDNSNDANANSNDDNSNDDNANANSNDDNANLNSNDDNSNDDNANLNSNDDNSNDNGNSNANNNGNSNDDDGGSSGKGNDNGDDDSGGGGGGSDDDGGDSGDD